jgi:hypothetical protein
MRAVARLCARARRTNLVISSSASPALAQAASDSSDIDNSDAESSLTPAQRKKKTLEKLAIKKRSAAAAKATAKLAYADDSDDSDDLDGSAAIARRKKAALAAVKKGSAGAPQIGSRMTCGECHKQFTYVRCPSGEVCALLRAASFPALTTRRLLPPSPSTRHLRPITRATSSVTSARRLSASPTTRARRRRPRRRSSGDRCVPAGPKKRRRADRLDAHLAPLPLRLSTTRPRTGCRR